MTTTGDTSVTDLDRLQQDLAARGVRYFFGAYTDVHGVPKAKWDAAGGDETKLPSLHSAYWAPEAEAVISTATEAMTIAAIDTLKKT